MLHVRYIKHEDIIAFDALLPEEWRIGPPVGFAAERDGELVAIGTVTWDRWGRCWAWYNSREQLPAITMHRRAREMMGWLREAGEPALYAICHPGIPGSVKWLERLGFVLDVNLTHPKGPVYRCDLSA